jgi:hypothetical protein
MAYLAWIASELGSATGFPKGNIIPQKPKPDEGQSAGRCVRYSAHSAPSLLPDSIVFGELVSARIVGAQEVIRCAGS